MKLNLTAAQYLTLLHELRAREDQLKAEYAELARLQRTSPVQMKEKSNAMRECKGQLNTLQALIEDIS